MATRSKQEPTSLLSELPVDRLKDEAIELGKAMMQRGIARLGESMSGATGKLGDLADAAPGPGDMAKAALKVGSPLGPVKDAASKVKDALPGGGSDDDDEEDASSKSPVGDDTDLKVTNIVETIDVPVDRETAYDLWTQFEEFPAFMKKVETVKQEKPEVLTWKAQVFWSHRTWKAKIVDQVRPEHVVWKSEGDKGRVDGAVTFHELAPDLTRVLVSLEYHPQGLFERTGNLWHAQGRRVRLELKHFRRHVANHALLHTDEVDGWSGEIHDGDVKRRRSSAKKSSARKSSTSNSGASSSSTSKSSASKSSASKSSASSSNGSSTTKSTAARKTSARKSNGSTSTAKKSPARKTAAKKSTSGSTSKRTAAARTSGASKRSSSTAKKSTAKKSASSRPRKSAAKKTARSGSTSRSTRSRS